MRTNHENEIIIPDAPDQFRMSHLLNDSEMKRMMNSIENH
jgi:hypothetical protein